MWDRERENRILISSAHGHRTIFNWHNRGEGCAAPHPTFDLIEPPQCHRFKFRTTTPIHVTISFHFCEMVNSGIAIHVHAMHLLLRIFDQHHRRDELPRCSSYCEMCVRLENFSLQRPQPRYRLCAHKRVATTHRAKVVNFLQITEQKNDEKRQPAIWALNEGECDAIRH